MLLQHYCQYNFWSISLETYLHAYPLPNELLWIRGSLSFTIYPTRIQLLAIIFFFFFSILFLAPGWTWSNSLQLPEASLAVCSTFLPGSTACCTFSDVLVSHPTWEDERMEPAHWPLQLKADTGCYLDEQQKCQCICNIFKDGSGSYKSKKYSPSPV